MLKQTVIGTWAVGYNFSPENHVFKIYVTLNWRGRWDDWAEAQNTSWGRGLWHEFDSRDSAEYYFNLIAEKMADLMQLKINNPEIKY